MKSDNLSEERKQYLRKIKRKKIAILVTQILVLVGLLVVWELLATYNLIDSFITSMPTRILDTLLHLGSNDLLHHIGVTAYETIVGFLIRYYFRIYYSCYFMVVRFFKKSCRTVSGCSKQFAKGCSWPNYYFMGWSGYTSNYCYGSCNFSSCNDFRNVKWF